jgi:hypothetical protein
MAGIFEDRPRSGSPKNISPEQEEAIVKATLHPKPKRCHTLEHLYDGGRAGRKSRHWSASGRNTSCSHTEANHSSSAPIRTLRARSGISWVCT